MLDIKLFRENPDIVVDAVRQRNGDTLIVEQVIKLDTERRGTLSEVESLKNERNRASKEIGLKKKEGKDTSEKQAEVRQLGERIAGIDEQLRRIEVRLQTALLKIPNIPHSSTPRGKDESGNVELRKHGTPREFSFEPKSHVEIGERLGILDLAAAAEMSGSGFPLFIGNGAKLQRALISFMLDLHTMEHGYTEIRPPLLCNSTAMTSSGQLPKMAEDMYKVEDDELYLVPTAEVPLTNLFLNREIDRPLPLCFTAYTPCFRREAGAAGKQTRGIIRVHQFDKVEMYKFVDPAESYNELETLLNNAEDVLVKLGLPYRVLELCTGDISFAAAKCYDVELWAPGQNDWLEVSSCSNCEDFQARRGGIRYRDKNRKLQYPHTLNGSGVALSRLVVAILENFQQADGSVTLPAAIVPYMGGVKVLKPSAG
ncbi:MAG: serine--tRNA ligase [Verrucomicrobiota bacterium]